MYEFGLPRVPTCEFERVWSSGQLRALVEEQTTGADVDILSTQFGSYREEILHELIYIYFGICCAERRVSAPRHGMRWTSAEDVELDRLNVQGLGPSQIAERLGRSPYAVALRVIETFRVRVPPSAIELLGLNPDEF